MALGGSAPNPRNATRPWTPAGIAEAGATVGRVFAGIYVVVGSAWILGNITLLPDDLPAYTYGLPACAVLDPATIAPLVPDPLVEPINGARDTCSWEQTDPVPRRPRTLVLLAVVLNPPGQVAPIREASAAFDHTNDNEQRVAGIGDEAVKWVEGPGGSHAKAGYGIRLRNVLLFVQHTEENAGEARVSTVAESLAHVTVARFLAAQPAK